MERTRRPYSGRTRTGCLVCRGRHKKCDEIRPSCTGCSRNKLSCTWPRRSPTSLERTATTHADSQVSKSKDDSSKSIHSCVNRSGTDLTTNEYYSHQSTRTPVESWRLLDSAGTPFVITYPRLSFPSPFATSMITCSSNLLLRHYFAKTYRFFAVKPNHTNPFIHLLIPLAFSHEPLLHAIIALSGHHMTGQYSSYQAITQTTWHHYGLALKQVRASAKEVTTIPKEKAMMLLTTLLILCNVEVSCIPMRLTIHRP